VARIAPQYRVESCRWRMLFADHAMLQTHVHVPDACDASG